MYIYETDGIIRVNIEEGLNFYELMEAIRVIAAIKPFYYREVVLQVLTEACTLSYMQVRSIIKQADETLKAGSLPQKVALVVNTGLQSGMARLFMEGLKDSGCKFEVFREPAAALTWLCHPPSGCGPDLLMSTGHPRRVLRQPF